MVVDEKLKNVSFTNVFKSRYLKPMLVSFDQGSRKRDFSLTIAHCSVATLLYHTEFKKFLIVRQFRPAVFIGRVSKFPENEGKPLEYIDWSSYDTNLGYTIELCAGLVDKDIPEIDIAREEIEEECGYAVSTKNMQYLASAVDADGSGSKQYLFYAEIDESMKLNEGGGNVSHGEVITKVFLDVNEAHAFVKDTEGPGPAGTFFALSWWFNEKEHKSSFINQSSFVWSPNLDGEDRMTNLSFQMDFKPNRYHPVRMSYTLGPVTRSWDLAPVMDSVFVYVYNRDTDSIILAQRFRPAVLVGRALYDPLNKNKVDPSKVDWASVPARLAYTLEMCRTKLSSNQPDLQQEKARQAVRTKLGYNTCTLEYVTSFILGISQGGDRQRIYYAEVVNADKVDDWSPYEDIKPASIPVACLPALFHQPVPVSPPALLYMTQWFLNRNRATAGTETQCASKL